MYRSWWLGVALVSVLVARENPFVPSSKEAVMLAPATNVQEKRSDFEQRSTKLPSHARILKYVIFGYQSLDGSIEEKKIEIDESIDWHDPLVITKESLLLDPSPVTPTQMIQTEELAQDPAMQKPVLLSVPPTPVLKKEAVNIIEKTAVSFQDFITFEARGKELIIETTDKSIRHFLVAQPYKIVVDFERDAAFYTKKIPLNQGSFKEITMGNHNGYYRAAILLDGHYRYNFKKIETGFIITLR